MTIQQALRSHANQGINPRTITEHLMVAAAKIDDLENRLALGETGVPIGFGDASKRILVLMEDLRQRAPFGYHEAGSSHPSYRVLILHSNDIERLLDQLLDAAIWTERAERLKETI